MGIIDELRDRAVKAMADPRVLAILQSEQLLRALTFVVELPDKLTGLGTEQGDRFAKNLGLATEDRVASLEARVKMLEAKLERLESASREA